MKQGPKKGNPLEAEESPLNPTSYHNNGRYENYDFNSYEEGAEYNDEGLDPRENFPDFDGEDDDDD